MSSDAAKARVEQLDRLRSLPPEKRAAVERLLKERGIELGPQPAAEQRIPLLPRAPGAAFALSFDQRRIWFLHQLDPAGSVQPHVNVLVRAPVEVLERAFNEVLARHEILRTTYRAGDPEPVQVIGPSQWCALEVLDLSHLSDAEIAEPFVRRIHEQRAAAFDLAAGPVWRALAARLSNGRSALALTVHHIATDGWSMNRLAREIEEVSEALFHGRAPHLPPPTPQYVDFAAWQRGRLRGEALEKALAYWRERLRGMPQALELRTDLPRPAMQTSNGSSLQVDVPAPLAEGLRRLAQCRQATFFMVTLALYKVLLARNTGQYDVVVGTPIAGRSHPELEHVQGLFVNSLVLRTPLGRDASFADVLARVRETVLGAFAHEDMPFDKVVEALQPRRDLSRNPLFQALFTKPIIDMHVAETAREDPIEGAVLRAGGHSEFDITLWVEEYTDRVRIAFQFNTDLFTTATVERWAAQYLRIAEAVIADDTAPIGDIDLLGERERERLLREWNATHEAFGDEPVSRLFERRAREAPLARAVQFEDEALSYAELNARANRLARHLRSLGIGPEARVAVLLERGIGMVVAVLAVMKAGGAYVPLDPAYPRERLQYMLADSEARVLLTEERLLGTLEAGRVAVTRIDADAQAIAAQEADDLPWSPRGGDLAYMIYTSGSTGRPKGVQVEHHSLANLACSMARSPGIAAQDVLVAVTTLSFDIAGLELYVPLIAGASVVIASRETASDGQALARLLERSRATVLQATPATWRLLLAAGWKGHAALKALCGGEAMPRELAEQLLARCGEVWNLYGPTETTIWSTACRVQSGRGAVPIGRPIANTQLYVLDERRKPVPVGVAGELYIGGAGVARGYWRQDALTAGRFVASPFAPSQRLYRTGDQARYLADGQLEYLGRDDAQVKLRGFRIELGEIESVLERVPGVAAAVAAVREDRSGDPRLVAYVVGSPGSELTVPALREAAARELPAHMIPATWVFPEALPLTPNGKVDRKALPAPQAQRVADAHFAAPTTPAERALAEIWSEVLGIERVGVHDNFFDLGGHSLLAMQSLIRLKERTGIALPPRDFYLQTLGQLAASVEGRGARPREGQPAPLEVEPFHFGSDARPLFGLLRRPREPRGMGVLVCPPHAHEYVRTHRALRELGQRLALLGFPVMSFDYFGTGDSGGEYQQGRLQDWEEDARAAIDELRRRAQVESVCVAGLRLGATIAMHAAARREDVRALALWDPIVHGAAAEADLAEIRAMQALDPAAQRDLYYSDVLAYPLTDSLAADIARIDLCARTPRHSPAMLVVETGPESDGRRLVDLARAHGARADYRRLEEARVWVREPYQAIVPRESMGALLAWIDEAAQ